MEGGGGEKGKRVGIAGNEVRKKVLNYTERVEKHAAAAVHSSSPGRKCASNGGGSIRRADDSKENRPLLLGDEDDDDACGTEDRQAKKGKQKEEGGGGWNSKMVHRPQVAEKLRHQLTAEVTADGLRWRAPNRREYNSPTRSNSMDGDKKLAGAAVEMEIAEGNSPSVQFADQAIAKALTMDGVKKLAGAAVEVELAEGNSSSSVQFADQVNAAGAKALIWSLQQAVEEAQGSKWTDAAAVKTLVESTVEKVHAAKWEGLPDAAAVKTFVKDVVEEAQDTKWQGLPDAAAIKSFVQQTVEEAQAAKWQGLPDAAAIKSFVQQTVEEAQAAKWEGLPDATALKRFVQRAVHQAQSEREALEENFIVLKVQEAVQEAVKVAVEESVRKAVVEHFSQSAPANAISAVDRTKLVKDALAEHSALSRALFVFVLGFTIPFLLARRGARPSDEELPVSDGVISGMAREVAFTFLIETVCYASLLFTHFVHTKGPRLSLTGRRITSTLIGCLVTLWMLFYTLSIPEWLFKHRFWGITSVFLVINWIFTICIGWFSCFVTEDRWIDN